MSHFAQINEDNIVIEVIVAEQDFIDSGVVGDPSKWIQTSYNTHNGIHYDKDGTPDDGIAIRGNYATLGCVYDPVLDIFYPPQSFSSWVFNIETLTWDSPIPYPIDGNAYYWDETIKNWI